VAVAEGRGVGSADDLGAYRALFAMPDPTDVEAIDPRVAALHRDGEVVLLDTVEVYLDGGASAARAAERLHIHRGTLYYRLRRFADLTGCDLEDGADRVLVHLALKAARLRDR
jgi:DNA-binding PucR family transcriptional regulator